MKQQLKIQDTFRRSDSEDSIGAIEAAILLKPYLPENQSVLEVGCGYGYFIDKLFQKHNQVTAIDISDNAIAHCQKFFSGKAKFTKTDINNFNSDTLFDCALLVNVLDQIPDDLAALRKINSLLCSDGILLLVTPITEKRYIQASIHRYAEEKLIEKVSAAGFRIKKKVIQGGVLSFFAGRLSKRIYFSKKILALVRKLPFYRAIVRLDAKVGLKKDIILLVCEKKAKTL
ncbi:MAG: class I SAM-dependent methyltransferase [Candidatus Diapherotrites archaeon]|nr:class I SAM-dependent methyltransferase [Candidatus Diapherotrites archaeon]